VVGAFTAAAATFTAFELRCRAEGEAMPLLPLRIVNATAAAVISSLFISGLLVFITWGICEIDDELPRMGEDQTLGSSLADSVKRYAFRLRGQMMMVTRFRDANHRNQARCELLRILYVRILYVLVST
jgi:hypothetical protein